MLQGLDPVMEGIVTDLEKVTDFSNLIKMNNSWFAKHHKAVDSSDSDADVSPTGNDSDDDKPSIAATAAAKVTASAAKVELKASKKAAIVENARKAAIAVEADDDDAETVKATAKAVKKVAKAK